ncbi:S1C family serine protease [Sediminibacillus halophilus]|uniref:Trypsin-like peptidase domain-containing protein n=1 Tax=Sediminibacillus halophilus TaxID=482461 RepID=A0A1G9N085_9BACI|nr:trypsin-like peptidase domain-containing protein [Sediminibacillus halophilus]SDL79661.1 Trypsin-like peptidase domain-containing protein [Sediminibacillus halophilus]
MKNKQFIFPVLLTVLFLSVGATAVFLIYQNWDDHSLELKNTLAHQVEEQQDKVNLKSIIHQSQKNVVQVEALDKWNETIGSGFLYNDKGDIITNAHVVENAETIYVKTANAQTYTAALVGKGDKLDIAVIRVPQLANQSPALLDTSYEAELGDEILAVGSPLGFQNSVTLGIISGLNRSFEIDDFDYEDAYQISAQINHGNSGGPLINRASGKVIAVNSAGIDDGSMGFSIPMQQVIDKAEQWSDQADDENLDYESAIANAQESDPDKLKEDAKYMINYFFESISIRDFINAYTLLGSDWQTETSYQQFREDYIYIVDTNTAEMNVQFDEENNLAKVTMEVEHEERSSPEKVYKRVYRYRFDVGYENDQVRLLKGKRELISEKEKSKES